MGQRDGHGTLRHLELWIGVHIGRRSARYPIDPPYFSWPELHADAHRDTLVPAATMGRAWRMRQDSRSPSYTTELGDVPVVRA